MILGIIPARAGSKRLPGKNTRPLCGKPLIAWTIEAAIRSGKLDRIVVSSDDEKAIDVAREYDVDIRRRPAWLATDTASIYDVVRQMFRSYPCRDDDSVVLLQPTSPLRTADDIDSFVGRNTNVLGSLLPSQSCARGRKKANGALYSARIEVWRDRTFNFDTNPKVRRYNMPPERSIDINTLEDFEACERYMKEHGWA